MIIKEYNMKFRDIVKPDKDECLIEKYKIEFDELNEAKEDIVFSKEIDGQKLEVHVHDGKFICKINGKELK